MNILAVFAESTPTKAEKVVPEPAFQYRAYEVIAAFPEFGSIISGISTVIYPVSVPEFTLIGPRVGANGLV